MKRASKLSVLEFIKQKDIVSGHDLVEKFNSSSGLARWMLSWLKRQGLVINDRRREWVITDNGIRRLIYYGRF